MSITRELEEEARRIYYRVLGFKKGSQLRATFKNGKKTKDIYYFNPEDIPLRVFFFYTPLYLWSVQKV